VLTISEKYPRAGPEQTGEARSQIFPSNAPVNGLLRARFPRRVTIGGITQHPTEEWMVQIARNAVDVIDGTLLPVRYALHDRQGKGNLLLFPAPNSPPSPSRANIICNQRLGGVLKFYQRAA